MNDKIRSENERTLKIEGKSALKLKNREEKIY